MRTIVAQALRQNARCQVALVDLRVLRPPPPPARALRCPPTLKWAWTKGLRRDSRVGFQGPEKIWSQVRWWRLRSHPWQRLRIPIDPAHSHDRLYLPMRAGSWYQHLRVLAGRYVNTGRFIQLLLSKCLRVRLAGTREGTLSRDRACTRHDPHIDSLIRAVFPAVKFTVAHGPKQTSKRDMRGAK
ncbi:hypothetical protein BC628DRAFT_1359043 [Trametes gibbosa]|nr:hypothetical protein BC628DRAFT_1359043 [Trametes gibbosa]